MLPKSVAFLNTFTVMHQTIRLGEEFFFQAFHRKMTSRHYEPVWNQMNTLSQSKSVFQLCTKNFGNYRAALTVMIMPCMSL